MRPFELGYAGTELRRRLVELVLAGKGEGFESVADWRAAHERFWADRGGIDDSTPIVAERFRVVERLP